MADIEEASKEDYVKKIINEIDEIKEWLKINDKTSPKTGLG